MSDMPPNTVFVSHSSRDRGFVEREIIPLLQRHGVGTWYSKDDIETASEWERTIRQGLETCDWFLVVLSPHWRKRVYLVPSVALPVVVGLVCGIILQFDRPRDLAVLAPMILTFQVWYCLGGVVGVYTGRPLARLLVRIFLPKKLRGPLGYLWRADGLEPLM